jgi:hypothetical protein
MDDGYLKHLIEDVAAPHTHLIPNQTTSTVSVKFAPHHEHVLPATTTTDATGATDPTGGAASDARWGPMLGYVKGMTVALDGIDITPLLLKEIKDPAWGTYYGAAQYFLGDGTAGHPLNIVGTGGIDLYRLTGVSPSDGEHVLEFAVQGPGEGGNVLWELYIE